MNGLTQKIESLRSQVAAVKSELSALRVMPIAQCDVPQRVAETIKALASRLDESALGALLAGATPPGSRDDVLRDVCFVADQPGILFAWLDPAGLTKKLTALARQHATGSIPLAERPQYQADLEARLYQLEAEEERLIVQAEAQGLEVFRRADCDPTIVLGLEETA